MVVVAKPKAKEEPLPASDATAADEGKADAVKSDAEKGEKKSEGGDAS